MLTECQLRIEASSIPVTESGCWLWLRSVGSNGYGLSHNGGKHVESAHRVSYKAFVGDIPAGMFVRHRCDTPLCVNPAHLLIGTHLDNVRDMHSRRRGRWGYPPAERGKCVHGHDLTGENVRECRGQKICRACSREAVRRYQQRKRAGGEQA